MQTSVRLGLAAIAVALLAILVNLSFSDSPGGPRPAEAANLTVTNANDSGAGSLREAIETANANGDDDVITFDGDYDIVLTSAELTVTSDNNHALLIDAGDNQITIDGDGSYRVFSVDSNANLTLTGITVTGGLPSAGGGGGITIDDATLTINRSLITGNSSGSGGGIFNQDGTVTLNDSVVSGNTSTGSAGGGITNLNGMLTLNHSVIGGDVPADANTAPAGAGGGILSSGPDSEVYVQNGSRVSGNSAGYYGGGIYNSEGSVFVTNSTISANEATTDDGGGIYSVGGDVTIQNSVIGGESEAEANTSGDGGGGIFNSAEVPGTLRVYDSTISGNTAVYGGGIANAFDTVFIYRSTISGNTATSQGGGIWNYGTSGLGGSDLVITDSTISGNVADGDEDAYGGGIYNLGNAAEVQLENVTLAFNSSDGDGSGIYNLQGAVELVNTIVSNNGGFDDCFVPAGTLTALDSLDDDGSCDSASTGAPGLGPLQDNGGPTWTHAIDDSSPAYDAGDATADICDSTYNPDAPAGASGDTDQRGFFRIYGGSCDIGAYEYQPEPSLTKTPSVNEVPANGGFVTFLVEITNPYDFDLLLQSLTDDVTGGDGPEELIGGDATDCTSLTIPADSSYSCSFERYVSGETGSQHQDTVTATLDEQGADPLGGVVIQQIGPIQVSGSASVDISAEAAPGCSADPDSGLVTPRCLVIVKQTDPGNANQSFPFEVLVSPPNAQSIVYDFDLEDGDTAGFDLGIVDTLYTISEASTDGWLLDSIDCDDNSGVQAIVIDGQTVAVTFTGDGDPYDYAVCIFTNQQQGTPESSKTPTATPSPSPTPSPTPFSSFVPRQQPNVAGIFGPLPSYTPTVVDPGAIKPPNTGDGGLR